MERVRPDWSVLQVPLESVGRDGDGYYLFPLPAVLYVQRLDGEPLTLEGDKKGYIRLTIETDGSVKTETEVVE